VTADDGLILSRFVHYAALLFAFGVRFFPFYAFAGTERQAALACRNKYNNSVLAVGLIALASGLSWLLFTAASMAGSLSEALRLETMSDVLTETSFGLVWSVHLGLIAAYTILAGSDRWAFRPYVITLTALSTASLASLAGVGHTQVQEGIDKFIHTLANGAHLLAAGAWLGGLFPLLALLTSWPDRNAHPETGVGHVLVRFSGMGYIAVALLIGTGAVNCWYLLPSLSRLPDTLYGQALIIKLGLFALMLVLAAMNRFWLVPQIQARDGSAQTEASLLRLRRHVIGEQLLGALIIALVSVLGTLAPAETQ
jgi:putative copper resistance protein D